MKVAWLIQNLVPYHHARFDAFSKEPDVEGHLIQVTDQDAFKILEFKAEHRHYDFHTLFSGREREKIRTVELQTELAKTLAGIKPDCVCVSGWGLEIGWVMHDWSLKNKIPVVLFSESTAFDDERKLHKEWLKSRLVKAAGSALVGGTVHRDYMQALGMSEKSIFLGHNVVDSSHFEKPAGKRPESLPEFLEGSNWFLCCTRFGEKKNLPQVVRAYALLAKSTAEAPALVLAGDGETRPEIERTILQEGMEKHVHMLGPVEYEALPWLYQNCFAFVHGSTTEQWGLVVNEAMAAGAPVLVSERCGCAPDLVQDGENGFRFDPFDEMAIFQTLEKFSKLSVEERFAMGQAGKRIMDKWGPSRFAESLHSAVLSATTRPRPAGGFIAGLILKSILGRSKG